MADLAADPGAGKASVSEIRQWLSARTPEMVELLRTLAEAESPTGDHEGLRGALAMVSSRLDALGFESRLLPLGPAGDCLLAYSEPSAAAAGGAVADQLLIGHIDTVWPRGTLERMPVRIEGERLHGPGTYDMKGGLVQAIFALEAIERFGLELTAPVSFFINPDEEVGSPDSRERLLPLAAEARHALVLEPSYGPSGKLKTARKGIGRFTITIHGRASHAGIEPERGASAILEASHLIQSLFALNDRERGITVNVGTIDGGMSTNVIAPEATAKVEVRVLTGADAEELEAGVKGLEPSDPTIELRIEGGFDRPPLEHTPRNRDLWKRAQGVAGELKIPLEEATVGGASDGNLTSGLTATLDGLGAVGDGAHADHEHVLIESMHERAALLAGLLTTDSQR